MQNVVALDQGSSSSRALWIEKGGRIKKRAQFPLRSKLPAAGWLEHDAAELWSGQRKALDAVLAGSKRPDALAVAAQRSTIVFWDADSGRPAGPAISWQDGRAAALVGPLQGLQQDVHERTGLYLTPFYAAPKIAWALKNLDGVKRLADSGRLRIGSVATYLVWKLTGGEVFACDPSHAQRTLLFDIDKLDWDAKLLETFGVSRSFLPEIRPSGGDWGAYKSKGQALPIRCAIGDQQAAALGLGAVEEGEAALNYGTGAFLLLNTGRRRPRIPGILSSVAGRQGAYLAEGTVHAAATSFEWLKSNFGLMKDVKALDGDWKASKKRVWCLPAIGGLGAPRWDYKTRTTWFGLDSQTQKADLVRGTGEGIAFLISDIAESIRSGGFQLKAAHASGGLSRVPSLIQFQADLFQVPIRVNPEKEVTALGAAKLAGLDLGRLGSGSFTVEPKLSPTQASELRGQWLAFVESTKALSAKIPA